MKMNIKDYRIDFDEHSVEVYRNGEYITDCLGCDIYSDLVKISRLAKFNCFKKLALNKAKEVIAF